MAKKNTAGQTSARMVMDVLKKHHAFSPNTAVGYDAFKNLPLSTMVIAYTIANLMESDVVMKTGDDRYYFVEENWKKMVRKVRVGYGVMIALPLIVLLVFLGIQMLIA